MLFNNVLVQVSPVRDGWAVTGRTDKYLCGAAVDNVKYSAKELSFELLEEGPFAVYCAKDTPKADGIELKSIGSGIYKADIKIADKKRLIKISR